MMTLMPDLKTALLDLLRELHSTDIKLILGGGYGIYLKTEYVQQLEKRTLLQKWPEPRSTNDIDVFLRPELLIDSARLKPLAKALGNLGYKAVPGAEKYQFIKSGPGGTETGSIKVDILTGPKNRFKGTQVKVDSRRARPHPSVGIHAHPVEEASTLEKGLLPLSLEGNLSTGKMWRSEIFLPHPFTFLLMKLFAFRDRFDDPDKEFGRYHALDLYTIMATTTEEEWNYGLQLRDQQHGNQPYMAKVGHLVSTHFSSLDGFGMIRLQESPYFRPEFELNEFMSALQELFPESD